MTDTSFLHLTYPHLQVNRHGIESWRVSSAAKRISATPRPKAQPSPLRPTSDDPFTRHNIQTIPPLLSSSSSSSSALLTPSILPTKNSTIPPNRSHSSEYRLPPCVGDSFILQRNQIEEQRILHNSQLFAAEALNYHQQRHKHFPLSSSSEDLQQRKDTREIAKRKNNDKFLLPPARFYLPSPDASSEHDSSSSSYFPSRKSLPASIPGHHSHPQGRLCLPDLSLAEKMQHNNVRLPSLKTALEMSREEKDNTCSNCSRRG